MPIYQDELTFVKVDDGVDGTDGKNGTNGKNGENGKDTYLHKAWSWSADGKDRFTVDYPNENLFSFKEINDLAPFATGIIGKNQNYKGWFHSVVENDVFSLSRIFPYSNSFGYYFTEKEPKNGDYWFGGNIYNTDNPVNNIKVPKNANFIVLYLSNSGDSINNLNVKIEKNYRATIYTPSPKDDYENAYPKYEGYYSSHNPVQSTNPSDYTWTVIRGENGNDGQDGVTPKDVISSYLTNDSIIVPATPTGTVTDYSKAYGDFVVFEGQDKVTGVSYSKVSETGMTSTINSAGRYTMTALTTDTAMAIYRATYSGVSIDKIVIAVKNKQGATGSTGPAGTNGTNGKDGATGPQGPPTGITTQPTIPTSPYIGMLWQNTGNIPGYLTGATYQWNGAKWNLYIFMAENIVASSLSAISAILGNVKAGLIEGSKFVNDGKFTNEGKSYDYKTEIDGPIRMRWLGSEANAKDFGDFNISPFKISSGYYPNSDQTLPAWYWEAGEEGISVSSGSHQAKNQKKTGIKDGYITLLDSNFYAMYGEVRLSYQDLMQVPKTRLTPATGYSIYSTSDTNEPTVKRNGRDITLAGAFKNNSQIVSSNDELLLGYLPEWAVPLEPRNYVVQGSGMNRFNLTVRPDGKIYWSRYGTNALATVAPGAWLNLSCSFKARDI